MKERKVYYYSDELEDEFSTPIKKDVVIDEKWKYIHNNIFYKFFAFIVFRIITVPLSALFLKIKFKHKIINKKVLKQAHGSFFIYGNHTQEIADPFIPARITHPRKSYVIVNSKNLGLPILGKVLPMLGALPLPDGLQASKNFLKAIEFRIKNCHPIVIYPEAKIWPYYTSIRPFVSTSFRYPIKYNAPVYCFTNTYCQKNSKSKVQIITYVDGPFYPDKNLTIKEQEQDLRDKCYFTMLERSKLNNVKVIDYIDVKNLNKNL